LTEEKKTQLLVLLVIKIKIKMCDLINCQKQLEQLLKKKKSFPDKIEGGKTIEIKKNRGRWKKKRVELKKSSFIVQLHNDSQV
jgi:hypothetical protein